MRRALILLALLAAGLGGGGAGGPTAAAGPHEIAAGEAFGPAEFVRSGSLALSGIGYDGAGPAPRVSARRAALPDLAAPSAVPLTVRHAAFEARSTEHRQYGTALALARAGLLSFHTNTPPPFRLI